MPTLSKKQLSSIALAVRNGQQKRKGTNKGAQRNPKRTFDYVQIPAAVGAIQRNVPPTYTVRNGRTVINHAEALLTVITGAAGVFTSTRTALIPGNFPWMFRIASSWQKFKITNLRAIYTPVCSTTISGEVILAMIYDRRDNTAANMSEACNIHNAVSAPYWGGVEGLSFTKTGPFLKPTPGVVSTDMDASHISIPYYPFSTTAAFGALTTADQNTCCPVSLDVYVNGGPSATEVGKVWIHYEIELVDPITPTMNV